MSSELRVDKIIPTAGVPTGGAGGVIQVVGTMNTTQVSTTVTALGTPADSGMSVVITPKFATSKILVQAFVSFGGKNNAYIQFKLQRNSTDIMVHTDSGNGSEVTGGGVIMTIDSSRMQYVTLKESMMAFDSPNTTSTVNYSVLWRLSNFSSGMVAYTNRAYTLGDDNQMRTTSQIVAMEVSA